MIRPSCANFITESLSVLSASRWKSKVDLLDGSFTPCVSADFRPGSPFSVFRTEVLLYVRFLTSAPEACFQHLGRKSILGMRCLEKNVGPPPVVAAPNKIHHLSVVPLLGAVTGGAKPTEVKVLFITATPL